MIIVETTHDRWLRLFQEAKHDWLTTFGERRPVYREAVRKMIRDDRERRRLVWAAIAEKAAERRAMMMAEAAE